jgi:forkhead transcription factor HCM1
MESYSLLPPANLSSPSKKSQLKTPPHSTLRISNLSSITPRDNQFISTANFSNSNNSLKRKNRLDNPRQISLDHNHHGHGLLSPEFSSPNLYEHSSSFISNNLIDIKIIEDSLNKENIDNQQPLEAPKFTKKRSISTINNNTNNSSDNNTTATNNKKQRLLKTPDDFILPNPDEMPDINFPSDSKPPYSYASLIGMALLRSTNRRLTLAEIYEWISYNFKYYKRGEVGWQNSIRHNLSLNKAFEKTEKSKEKKGHFWQIVPGYEHIYCNIKETKRNNSSINNKNDLLISKSQSPNNANDTDEDAENDENDENDDDDDASNNISLQINNSQTLLLTPKDNYQYHYNTNNHSHLLTHKNFNHIYQKGISHSRNPSDSLGSIPELNIQYSSYNASPINLFNDFSPGTNMIANSSIDFTSSFSCRSNFELSPIKPIEPGPILEPLTPNRFQIKPQLPSISKQLLSLQPSLSASSSSSSSLLSNPSEDKQLSNINTTASNALQKFKSPLKLSNTSNNQNQHSNNINTQNNNIQSNDNNNNNNNNNYNNNMFNSANPINSSIAKKLWASPSYLDDFFTSPVSTNKIDSVHYNPLNIPKLQPFNNISNIYGSPVQGNKRRFVKYNSNIVTNGYSTNEIFGIDICTIQNQDDDGN